jgi:hypothetical protein
MSLLGHIDRGGGKEMEKWKMFWGVIFFLIDSATLAFGVVLTLIGVGLLGQSSGEGDIKVVIEKLFEITGINGHLLLVLAGVFVVFSALGYASKAVVEAIKYEQGWKIGVKDGLKDTVQHFNPSL